MLSHVLVYRNLTLLVYHGCCGVTTTVMPRLRLSRRLQLVGHVRRDHVGLHEAVDLLFSGPRQPVAAGFLLHPKLYPKLALHGLLRDLTDGCRPRPWLTAKTLGLQCTCFRKLPCCS